MGRRDREIISDDPNNKFWANDKTKFGYKLMLQMGWSDGKGLGKNEDGQSDHIKVLKKVDNRGVSSTEETFDASKFYSSNTVVYNALLQRLNNAVKQNQSNDSDSVKVSEEPMDKETKKRLKREKKEAKRKAKEERRALRREKKQSAAVEASSTTTVATTVAESVTATATTTTTTTTATASSSLSTVSGSGPRIIVGTKRVVYNKFMRMKRLNTTTTESDMKAILGLKQHEDTKLTALDTQSQAALRDEAESPTSPPNTPMTPSTEFNPDDVNEDGTAKGLRTFTSGTTVQDYFKAKMLELQKRRQQQQQQQAEPQSERFEEIPTTNNEEKVVEEVASDSPAVETEKKKKKKDKSEKKEKKDKKRKRDEVDTADDTEAKKLKKAEKKLKRKKEKRSE